MVPFHLGMNVPRCLHLHYVQMPVARLGNGPASGSASLALCNCVLPRLSAYAFVRFYFMQMPVARLGYRLASNPASLALRNCVLPRRSAYAFVYFAAAALSNSLPKCQWKIFCVSGVFLPRGINLECTLMQRAWDNYGRFL